MHVCIEVVVINHTRENTGLYSVDKLKWILRPILVCVKSKFLFIYRHISVCISFLCGGSQNLRIKLSWKSVAASVKRSSNCLRMPFTSNVLPRTMVERPIASEIY